MRIALLLYAGLWLLGPMVAAAADRTEVLSQRLSADAQASASPDRPLSAIPPLPATSAFLFHDPPTLTTRYALGTSFLPFIGMGFQGGEISDITRQALRGSTFDTRTPLSNRLNQGLVPNEFQAGLRIPF